MAPTWRRSPGGSFNDPEPGERIYLVGPDGVADGRETRIRQVQSTDDRLGVHEVRDDRGQVVYITRTDTLGEWLEVLEI